MHYSRSLLATAALLSFSITTKAAVAQRRILGLGSEGQLEEVNAEHGSQIQEVSDQHLRKRQESDAPNSSLLTCGGLYWNILYDAKDDDTQTFCNQWLNLPPATTEVESQSTV